MSGGRIIVVTTFRRTVMLLLLLHWRVPGVGRRPTQMAIPDKLWRAAVVVMVRVSGRGRRGRRGLGPIQRGGVVVDVVGRRRPIRHVQVRMKGGGGTRSPVTTGCDTCCCRVMRLEPAMLWTGTHLWRAHHQVLVVVAADQRQR